MGKGVSWSCGLHERSERGGRPCKPPFLAFSSGVWTGIFEPFLDLFGSILWSSSWASSWPSGGSSWTSCGCPSPSWVSLCPSEPSDASGVLLLALKRPVSLLTFSALRPGSFKVPITTRIWPFWASSVSLLPYLGSRFAPPSLQMLVVFCAWPSNGL